MVLLDSKPPHAIWRDSPDAPELVAVPGGRYLMGGIPEDKFVSSVELPRHPVTVAAFALGKAPVTCGEWRHLMGALPDACAPGLADEHPVVNVTFSEALGFLRELSMACACSYRLPSEAEWEYAAKAGSRALQAWGGAAQRHCRHANSNDRATLARYPLAWRGVDCDDGFADVAPVGSFAPNAFGLHDMIGNVWEWAEDCSSLSYFGRPVDQRAWVWEGGCKRRIQRGGGWSTGPERSRPGFHGDGDDEDRADFAGFRVARDLP